MLYNTSQICFSNISIDNFRSKFMGPWILNVLNVNMAVLYVQYVEYKYLEIIEVYKKVFDTKKSIWTLLFK